MAGIHDCRSDFVWSDVGLETENSKILGSYFFFMRGRVITSPWMNKFYLMWDSFSRQRTDGALVRAEMVVAPGQSMDDAWVELADSLLKCGRFCRLTFRIKFSSRGAETQRENKSKQMGLIKKSWRLGVLARGKKDSYRAEAQRRKDAKKE